MDDQYKFIEVIENWRMVNKCIHENHHKWAEEYGLTLEQYHLLLRVKKLISNSTDKNSEPTIGQLAQIFNNAQNTMSEKISRLEKREFVKRVRDERDRRIIRILLTNKGEELLNSIHDKAKEDSIFNALIKMDDNLFIEFSKGLKALVKNMQ